jgi:hypothetical protein
MLKQLSFDWEHEAQKDLVYLQEELTHIEQEVNEIIHRKPAIIQVIDKDKILNREHEHQDNPLPF